MFHQGYAQLPLQVRRQASVHNRSTTTENQRILGRSEISMHLDIPCREMFIDEDEDFPTPRALPRQIISPKPTGAASSCYSPRRVSEVSCITSFEEDKDLDSESISDVSSSDAESIEVPFKVSNSVKKAIKKARAKQARPTSIAIPSPSAWPRSQHSFYGQNEIPCSVPRHSSVQLSPDSLAKLSLLQPPQLPTAHSTPSLGGSSITDDHNSYSCPSTPDLRSQQGDDEWEFPVQLHPEALSTLARLSDELPSKEFAKSTDLPVILEEEPVEMKSRGLSICIPESKPSMSMMDDLFTPISVPSPGGFFASLSGSSSTVWATTEPTEPDTSEAESFYGVPFRDSSTTLPQVLEVGGFGTDGPPTARRLVKDTFTEGETESDYPESLALDEDDIDENYASKLEEAAGSSRSRTDMWIEAQERYLDFLKNPPSLSAPASEVDSVKSHRQSSTSTVAVTPVTPATPKKSVRFADTATTKESIRPVEERPRDSVLYHAFQHLLAQAKPRDAYIHRESRVEALRMQRSFMKDTHRSRLRGQYNLKATSPVEKSNWSFVPKAETEEARQKREAIVNASKEQRALQQLATSSWALQASRFLDGGSLLPHAALEAIGVDIAAGNQARVLDFGGQATAGWGWDVAVENRDVKVYTVIPTDKGLQTDWLEHRGPSNHRIVTCPNAWTLPFPSDMFTVISARSLHSMLQTRKIIGHDAKDQYGACLAELYRVLAPGGVIHFSLLDAEMDAPANSCLAAKGIEFAVSLRVHGYDPCASRHIVERMGKAGFTKVRRTALNLPWASAIPQPNDGVTGLVGSLQWESWLLKHQTELGRSEDTLLDGVPEALNEAKRLAVADGKPSSWRILVGCASKPE